MEAHNTLGTHHPCHRAPCNLDSISCNFYFISTTHKISGCLCLFNHLWFRVLLLLNLLNFWIILSSNQCLLCAVATLVGKSQFLPSAQTHLPSSPTHENLHNTHTCTHAHTSTPLRKGTQHTPLKISANQERWGSYVTNMQPLQAEHLSSRGINSFELLTKGGTGMVTFVCPLDRATDAQVSSQTYLEVQLWVGFPKRSWEWVDGVKQMALPHVVGAIQPAEHLHRTKNTEAGWIHSAWLTELWDVDLLPSVLLVLQNWTGICSLQRADREISLSPSLREPIPYNNLFLHIH